MQEKERYFSFYFCTSQLNNIQLIWLTQIDLFILLGNHRSSIVCSRFLFSFVYLSFFGNQLRRSFVSQKLHIVSALMWNSERVLMLWSKEVQVIHASFDWLDGSKWKYSVIGFGIMWVLLDFTFSCEISVIIWHIEFNIIFVVHAIFNKH